jgi:hypothetical protein
MLTTVNMLRNLLNRPRKRVVNPYRIIRDDPSSLVNQINTIA